MNDINQYYEILELKPGASLEDVKQAYKDLAMVWHPDRFSTANPRVKERAQEKLKRINAAYEMLKSCNFSSSTQTSSSKNEKPGSVDANFYYEQGMEKAKGGRYQEAIEDFSYAICISPDCAEAYKYRSIAHLKIGENQKAINDLQLAVDLYLKQKNLANYQDALERLTKLRSSEPPVRKNTQPKNIDPKDVDISRLFPG